MDTNKSTNTPQKSVPLVVEGYNARGLNDDKKRGNAISWLKKRKNADFIALTETKCHLLKDKRKWAKEWSLNPNDSFWSLGTRSSKGVTILVTDKFNNRDAKILSSLEDPNGRFVKLMVEIGGLKYRIVIIYSPCSSLNNGLQQINFFVGLHDLLNDSVDAETLLGGDYNCTMRPEIDRINCTSKDNDKGHTALHQLAQTHDLEDIWRIQNPDKKQYTWFGHNNKASRIDFWLTSASLNGQIEKISSHYFPFSDHHGTRIELRTHEIKTGKGVWKMNGEHILTQEYKEQLTRMWQDWQTKKHEFGDITKWWDLGKIQIKRFTRNFSIEQSIRKKSKLNELEEEITQLKNSMSNADRLIQLQNEHDDILTKDIEGARVRSRLQWWEEGEKSSKYFHSLEKRNGKNKAWDKILGIDGNLIYGTNDIQKQQVLFYKNLFSSQNVDGDQSFFLSNPDKKLSEDNKQRLETDISKMEIAKAIKKMPNNKSPGEDGIIIEFYKVFWNLIGDDLHEVFVYGLQNKQISYSQYLSLIVLLYKKGPRENIKNWRPISLLNVDYKILSKVLAERLKGVLPDIIHNDQKGCVKGRYIGENIRLIEDTLYEIEHSEDDSIILLQDQEKAFDRVEWSWLFSTLKHFNFGDTFIDWLYTLYKNAKSSIITNGQQSAYFNITRGIRQGDSLSALLYIIQLEPLAQKLRETNKIKGIKIKLDNMNNSEIEIKGCQYVDDCNTFLKDKSCINDLADILNRYEEVSGSKVNFDKTKALAIKNLPGLPREKIKDIELIRGPEKALGVPIGGDDKQNNAMWENLISKLKSKLNIWKLRNLSLAGKTHIIRSVGVSKLLYSLEMKTIEDTHIKKINDIFWDFLWSGKNLRFSKRICYLPKQLGGLNLVDIKILEKVKRINWVIRFLKDDTGQTWAKLSENYFKCLDARFGVNLFSLKVNDAAEIIKNARIPIFYKECIIYFQELLNIARVNLREEFIWCNAKYKFNNKTLKMAHWARDGILRPSQLYTNGKLDPINIARQLTHQASFIFEFQTIRSVFPLHSNAFILQGNGLKDANKRDILDYVIKLPGNKTKSVLNLTSKDIYQVFLHHNKPDILARTYWSTHMFPGQVFDWEFWGDLNFTNPILPRKCQDHNFKIFHGILSVESRLKRFGYSNGMCRACDSEIENVEHLLVNCQYRLKIWTLLKNTIERALGHPFQLNRLEILTGYFNADNHNIDSLLVINMLIGMVRYHLWLSRNLIRYESKIISFAECYLKLKHYLIRHINTLMISKTTKTPIKAILPDILDAIKYVFRNGLREIDL